MNLKGFFKECYKKEVFKMLSIYFVSSWVLLQVLALISEPVGLPIKSVTYLIVILLIGLPIYIYYIWKFKLLKYEIQQTKDPNTTYNKSAFQKMYFSSLLVVALISGISITLIVKNSFKNSFSLEKLKGNNKIAVLEFENTTANENLNNVGKIASNWIIHGITENQLGQVISPKLVTDYVSILKSAKGTANLNNILKNYFRPDKIIEGVYYEENDTLLLQGSIKDGLIDKTLISFKTEICNPDSPLDCAENLKQQILGYLSTVAKQDNLGYIQNKDNKTVSSYYEETPPNYESYQYLLNAYENRDNGEIYLSLLNKSIAADSNFFEPKTHRIAYYYNENQYKIADSLRKSIPISSHLNNRQRNWMTFYEAILSGKNNKVYKSIKEEYSKAYKDMATNMTTMVIALQFMNRPEDIEAIYNEIPMDELNLEDCSRCAYRYYLKGLADVELKNYTNVIETLAPVTNVLEDSYLKRPLIMAYIKSNSYTALNNYLTDYALVASENDINYLNAFTGIQFLNTANKERANSYFDKIINKNVTTKDSINLAQAYYFKENYKKAQDLYNYLHEVNPKNIDYLVRLAISTLKNGDIESARTHLKKLNTLRSEYQFGAVDYGIAQYYAAKGEIDKSKEFLLKAVVQGYNYTPTTFQNDPHFNRIKTSPEFENKIMNYWKNKTL